jgi:hypothetical protein
VIAAVFFTLGIGYLTIADRRTIGLLWIAGGLAYLVIGLIRFTKRKPPPDITEPS